MDINRTSSFILSSILCLAGCGASYSRDELLARTTPPLERKWDIEAKNNTLVFDFEADWGSPYRLFLVFRPANGEWTDEEDKAFHAFLGDGSQVLVTAESAHSDHPVALPLYTPEDLEFMKRGGVLVSPTVAKNHTLTNNERVSTPPTGGVFIFNHPGTLIPIHEKIETIDDNHETGELVKEYDITTAGASIGAGRGAGGIALSPGHYKFSINTTKQIKLPPNTEAYLQLDRKGLK